MTGERWREALRVYLEACALPPGEQPEFLRSANLDGETASILESMLADDAVEAEPEAWPQVGRRIGRFQIEAPLGRGGMGEVYAARDTDLNRTVALKFLAAASVGSSGHVNRFIREAQAASALSHPGIVTVHEVVRSGESLAIVMELVDGQPLRELCGRANAPAVVAGWGRQVARALSAAHAHGIVHRDIKPENVMLRRDGFVKVVDFGLARSLETTLSGTLAAAGTLRYMAPEQARGAKPETAGDIFSLGVVLYELTAGEHPFAEDSAIDTAHAMARREPAPLSRKNPDCPAELEALLQAMLSKDPAERPGAAEVAGRLEPIESGTYVRPARRRKWPVWAAACLGLAAAGGAGWLWMGQRRNTPEEAREVAVLPPAPLHAPAGNEGQPAFSPDGERVAYTWDRGASGGNRVILVQSVSGGAAARLTDTAADDSNPAWSPDGREIAFLRRDGGTVSVMVAIAASGAVRRVSGIVGEQPANQELITWTPDGTALVVADVPPGRSGNLHLYRLALDGSRTELSAPPEGSSDVAPAYSPDGRHLAYLRATRGAAYELLVQQGANVEPRVLVHSTTPINSFAWTPDSRRLVYGTGASVPDQMWEVSATGGSPERTPFRLFSPARQIAIAPRGRRLAYVRPLTDSNIWRIEGGRVEPWIASPQEDMDPRYSPDGRRIAFASWRTEMSEIWVCERDGSNPRQLTFQRAVSGSPAWSPNGRQIAFNSSVGGLHAIWLVGAEGGQPRRLVEESADGLRPTWSSDGNWVYFSSTRTGHPEIWKARFTGGLPEQVTRNGGYEAYESADGRFLYYTKVLNQPGIWRMPVEGGAEELAPELGAMQGDRYWEVASNGIYFTVKSPRPAVNFFDFKTGRVRVVALVDKPPTRLTNPVLVVRGLAVAPDGKSFLYVRFDSERMNVLLAEM